MPPTLPTGSGAAVHLFATLDTKGGEADFVRQLLTSWKIPVTLVDVGSLGPPTAAADIPRERIFELAGTTFEAVRARGDRGQAVTKAAEGAMKALPLGVPKVMARRRNGTGLGGIARTRRVGHRRDGQPFDDPSARRALHDAVRAGLPGRDVAELDLHINDPASAEAAAGKLLDMLRPELPKGDA